MYFLRRLRPLEVAGERTRSLRASLNAPVITAADLPPGPARAVIVVHRELRGRMDATVGVRSLASGEIAYWSFDGELTSDADLSVAADAALTFAESLGFLFDEVPLSGAAAEKAFRAWRTPPASSLPAIELDDPDATGALVDPGPGEFELDDIVADEPPPLRQAAIRPAPVTRPATPRRPASPAATPVLPPARPVFEAPKLAPPPAAAAPTAAPPPPAPAPAPVPAAQKQLSKFRSRDAAPPPAPAPGAPAAQRKAPLRQPLARVQLVKRRSPEEERKLVIRKLVTSF